MKQLLALMFLITFFAHAAAPEPGSQYLKAAEGGDRRAQYYLADSWFSSGDLGKAEYWAQKAADNGDADACALLAQIKITNPVSLDYPGAKRLAEKAAKAGSKAGKLRWRGFWSTLRPDARTIRKPSRCCKTPLKIWITIPRWMRKCCLA
ncbi:putative exported protein [Salmonella enterica subsp. arizonae]|nr:putative exported protein [Salmonella enterica subsp. arizonae]